MSGEAHGEGVGLVLAGGGARGAYEVGVLSALLPALAPQEWPSLVLGTSVGALNAAWIAAHVHEPVDELVVQAKAVYETLEWDQVLAPPWSPTSISNAARYALGAFGIRRARVPALLDPAPLVQTLARLIPDFDQIARNIADPGCRLSCAAVVATSALTSRSVVFHQGGVPEAAHDRNRGIDYAAAALTAEHVRASAAIPGVFPAVHVDSEPGRGWYFDGGTRLNTPIKPALWLGAERVIAIGLNSIAAGPDEPLADEHQPDLFAGFGQILVGLLADPLAHDIQTLAGLNSIAAGGTADADTKVVPYMFIAPESRDTIGALAAEVFRERYRNAGFFKRRSPELAVLGRALEGDFAAANGELLSYLFFDPEFGRALIAQGRADGERWVKAAHDDGLWQHGPLPLAGSSAEAAAAAATPA